MRTLETRVLLVAVIPVFAGPVSDRTGLTSLYISVTQPECNYKLISREHRGKNLIFICLSLTLSLSLHPAKTRLDIDWNSGVSSPGLAGHHYWAERLLYIDCNDPTRPHQTPADLTWLQCSVQAWGPRLMWWLRPAVTSAPSLALWDLNNSLKHKAWWEVQGRQDLSCLSFIQIHSNYVRRSRYASCQDVDLTQ